MSNKAIVLRFDEIKGDSNGFEGKGAIGLPFAVEGENVDLRPLFHGGMAFAITPFENEGKKYNKAAIETLINLLQDVMQAASKNITVDTIGKQPSDRMTEDGIPVEMLYNLISTVNGLTYMINCTSWRTATPTEGSYEGFDKFELESRIRFK